MREPANGNARGRRTRAALLDATRDILERSGFGGLTMAAVAARAGVSRRAVYLHFETRTDLITALFDHVSEAEGLRDSLRPVFAAPDARAALRAWARHLAYFQPRVTPVYQAARAHAAVDPDAALHLAQVGEDQRSVCARIAHRLAAENRLAAPWTVPAARDMLWALISPDMTDRLLNDQGWSHRRLADHLDTLLAATFLTIRQDGTDAEPRDAEPPDAEPRDAEPPDAEPPDAEPPDAEAPDADAVTDGVADAGPPPRPATEP